MGIDASTEERAHEALRAAPEGATSVDRAGARSAAAQLAPCARARARADHARARDPLDADAAHGGRHRAIVAAARSMADRRAASSSRCRCRRRSATTTSPSRWKAAGTPPRDAAADRRAGAMHAARSAAARTARVRHHGEPLHGAERRELGRGRSRRPHDARRVDGGGGGPFVGVNPLHALRNEGYDVSPYSPDHATVPQSAVPRGGDRCRSWRTMRGRASRSRRRSCRRAGRAADASNGGLRPSDGAARAGARVAASHLRGTRARRRELARPRVHEYVAREDPQLTQFATFMAIAEREGPDARTWPEALRDANARRWPRCATRARGARGLPSLAAVRAGPAARAARRPMRRSAGLALGLYQDLAVGSAPSGSDVWANPGLFVQGATVGAPPDMYSDEGQNWGLPAMDPHVLRETRLRLLDAAAARRLPPRRCAATSTTRSDCSGCSGCRSASRRARART